MIYKTSEKQREYRRRYYQEHRAKILEQKRRYYQEHRAQCNERSRRYHRSEAGKVACRKYEQSEKGKVTRRRYQRNHYRTNSRWFKEQKRRYEEQVRQKALALFGNRCSSCGSQNNLQFHKKDGQPHKIAAMYLALRSPEQFELLCEGCHKKRHAAVRAILADMG